MPEITDIYNFLPLTDSLLTSGQPTEAQYPALASAGVQTVVNLAVATSDNALPDEAGLARSLGLDYIQVPVLWDNPSEENFNQFVATMDRLENGKVLVHCAANMRASAFVALYRIRRLGWEPGQAFKDVYRIWDPYTDPVWAEFVTRILNKK
jgi:protein tyrosine phosphatase (PTP) superfamily phosphohydrolase (DUF442 family)